MTSAAFAFCTCIVTAVMLNWSYGYPSPEDTIGVHPLDEVRQSLEPSNDQQSSGIEERGAAVRTFPWDVQRGATPEDMMQVEEQRYSRGYPTPYYYGSRWGGYGGYYPWGGWGQYPGLGRALYYPYAYYG